MKKNPIAKALRSGQCAKPATFKARKGKGSYQRKGKHGH